MKIHKPLFGVLAGRGVRFLCECAQVAFAATAGLVVLSAVLLLCSGDLRSYVSSRVSSRLSRKTVNQRVQAIFAARPQVRAAAEKMGGRLDIFVFKEERMVELWAPGWDGPRLYRMTGFSGGPGPKLREGDGQIPEGVYGIEYLNPNSAFHLSLKVSYPNAFDKARAEEDGRKALGNDIMIHGGSATVGCIPIGDEAIEEVFCYAAQVGRGNVQVVISPYDMRGGRVAAKEQSDLRWYGDQCAMIADSLVPGRCEPALP